MSFLLQVRLTLYIAFVFTPGLTDSQDPKPDEKPVSPMEPKKSYLEDEDFKLVEQSNHDVLVEFQEASAADPNNWCFGMKVYIILTSLLIVMNSGISAALPSNAIPSIMQYFHQSGSGPKVLPTAVFLIGYIVGPLLFSPMSETVGRRPVLLWTFTVFVLVTLGCALAPNWPALLVLRTLCGLMAAAPQTVVGGVYADLFSDLRTRGRAMCFYMSAASFGPILGPIISGCAVQYGWRWVFRIDVILSGSCWIGLLFMPETFSPVILKKKAAKLRKQTGSNSYFSRQELKNASWRDTMLPILTRPIMMLISEPIILSTAIYISLAYSLVFFFFQAYPIIYEGTYGFDVQTTSFIYIPIGIGAASSGLVTFYYDTIYEKAKKRGKEWTSSPELHRLPLSCLAGPAMAIALFWLAWSAKPNIHWAVPVLSGLLFGFGYQLVFISLLTHLAKYLWCSLSSCRGSSLFISECIMGYFDIGVHQLGLHPDSFYSALCWAMDSREKFILSAAVGGGKAQKEWTEYASGSMNSVALVGHFTTLRTVTTGYGAFRVHLVTIAYSIKIPLILRGTG
ncbi:MFS multidrug transporter [Penicillium riverlandense]|uniref:MFS multidrug transporter n=1 Tax=Penicillium riverlandense TaxID=1903569 RepID=UPI0025496503|nr:MFS multidrug transporter [Penicillium riverlandense]KAJ5832113.1 MFS multidrug transporter [Penicillium riverlandense]